MAVWVCKRLGVAESAKVVKRSTFLRRLIVNEFFGNGSSFGRRSNRCRVVVLFPLVSQEERITAAVRSWLSHHAYKPLIYSLIVHDKHLVLLSDWHAIATVKRTPALVELIIHIILVLFETKVKRSIEVIVVIETSLAILRRFEAWLLAFVKTVNQMFLALRSNHLLATMNTTHWAAHAVFSSSSWWAHLWSFLWTVLHDIFNKLFLSQFFQGNPISDWNFEVPALDRFLHYLLLCLFI